MLSSIRKKYNKEFSPEKYAAFKQYIGDAYGQNPAFRVAETPIFVPSDLKKRLIQACDEISDTICRPDFKQMTEGSLAEKVPNEDAHTQFLILDFGITKDEKGNLHPQLIEAQGFPSLYFFQNLLANAYQKHFYIPENKSIYFNGYDEASYNQTMKKLLLADSKPENVVLLEIDPHNQGTRIDFYATQAATGIKILCLSEVRKSGRDLYYEENGKKIDIERIYNRVIFDELDKKREFVKEFDFRDEINAEWVGHPNWFFRISKFTLPFFKSKYVPETHFLHTLPKYPDDLEHYVLKPLYSFAGMGVKINITRKDLDEVADKHNFILQKKVKYEPIIQTPNPAEPVKCEIRMMLIWEKGAARPVLVNNIVRLSKGEMIGVRFNKDKDWVGGTVGFF
jgi:hypothetical protein